MKALLLALFILLFAPTTLWAHSARAVFFLYGMFAMGYLSLVSAEGFILGAVIHEPFRTGFKISLLSNISLNLIQIAALVGVKMILFPSLYVGMPNLIILSLLVSPALQYAVARRCVIGKRSGAIVMGTVLAHVPAAGLAIFYIMRVTSPN